MYKSISYQRKATATKQRLPLAPLEDISNNTTAERSGTFAPTDRLTVNKGELQQRNRLGTLTNGLILLSLNFKPQF